MLNGKYRIYKNGKLVIESNNAITEFGKDSIVKYLANAIPAWADSIAVGAGPVSTVASTTSTALIGATTITVASATGISAGQIISGTGIANGTKVGSGYVSGTSVPITIGLTSAHSATPVSFYTAPTSSNSKLDFEFSRGTVSLKSPKINGSARSIVIKASLEPGIAGVIREVGAYTSLGSAVDKGYDGRILTMFDEGQSASDLLKWSVGSPTTANNLIGNANLILNNATTYLGAISDPTYPGAINLDLSGYTAGDTLNLTYTALATGTSQSLNIIFYDNQNTPGTLTWNNTISPTINTGYTLSTLLGSMTSSGNFNYNVSAIKIVTTANLSLDAMRIDDTDTLDTTFGLVSRTVLNSSIIKSTGDSIDIEYEITLGL
jgi:hypothetical protein